MGEELISPTSRIYHAITISKQSNLSMYLVDTIIFTCAPENLEPHYVTHDFCALATLGKIYHEVKMHLSLAEDLYLSAPKELVQLSQCLPSDPCK